MTGRPESRLGWTLFVTIAIFAAEAAGGILSNSLALLSDAGHVLTDSFAIGLSLVAALIMRRPSDFRATYGYQRIGLAAALINGLSLVVISLMIFIEAYRRLLSPPPVDTSMMLMIALIGFAGNLVMALILGRGHEDLNIRSAWLHVIGDTVSSAGVIVAGVVIALTGWRAADPLAGFVVGCIIIAGGIRVIREALRIFLEWSPAKYHVEEMASLISAIPGVCDVHDIHIWSIGHGVPALTCHVRVEDRPVSEADRIRDQIELKLTGLGIKHSVIQIECSGCEVEGHYCRLDEEGKT